MVYAAGTRPWRENMLLIIVALIASGAIVIGSRVRIQGRANGAQLGWMSQQWLADYRASHLT